jgi:hypothetical protein
LTVGDLPELVDFPLVEFTTTQASQCEHNRSCARRAGTEATACRDVEAQHHLDAAVAVVQSRADASQTVRTLPRRWRDARSSWPMNMTNSAPGSSLDIVDRVWFRVGGPTGGVAGAQRLEQDPPFRFSAAPAHRELRGKPSAGTCGL